MTRVNGKQKGSEFERQICKRLSLWLSNGKKDDCLWRSALSGGRATIGAKKGKLNTSQVGDISAIDPMGQWLMDKFIVECKSYRDLDFQSGLLKRKGLLHDFWRILKKQCKGTDRQPLLIAKQNNVPIIFLTTKLGEEKLGLEDRRGGFTFSAAQTHRVAILSQWGAVIYLFDGCLEKVASPLEV